MKTIKDTDVVLEIGSGNNPNPRADILCDRFIHSNHQRAGEFAAVIDRPMVVADGYALPFKDAAFDYVICSHILEHMEDPVAFLKEVTRVAWAGYIEVPSIYAERLFGWNFHLWYSSGTKKGIRLVRKKGGERFGGFFHRLIAQQIWFRRWFEENEQYFNIHYEWKGKPSITVLTTPGKESAYSSVDLENWDILAGTGPSCGKDIVFWITWMFRRIRRKLTKMFRKTRWEIMKRVDADSILSTVAEKMHCVRCHKPVFYSSENILCTGCGQSYPIDNAMPIMLLPPERKKGY